MTLIIAEVAQAHEGSLALAHSFVDAVAEAGADAVKFQCHIAEEESTPTEPWRVEPRWPQDLTRYDYWRRMQFTDEQWHGLAKHAEDAGLLFLCSPFSVRAVELLDPLVPAWKIPSGEITNKPLLRAIRETGKPVILSTGMATYDEIHEAIEGLSGCYVKVLQCTSAYPCPPEKVGLGHVSYFDGLSDHSGSIYPALAAVALGAQIIEVHVTFSRLMYGFDSESSVTMDELKELVEGAKIINRALKPVDKDEMALELKPMRDLFMERWKRCAASA